MKPPTYDLVRVDLEVVRALCAQFHGYGSAGANGTYAFAVYENGYPVAGFAWQPPPLGAARSVAPEEPGGVLSLSRMVAVPHDKRRLKHISKPLRRQMRTLIDRGRWPVLVTYSDEGQGHTGHVYKCSGWQPTRRSLRPFFVDGHGKRASSYSNGRHGSRGLARGGTTTIQRWEHRVCAEGAALDWMTAHGWYLATVDGKMWRSGNPQHTWLQRVAATDSVAATENCRDE